MPEKQTQSRRTFEGTVARAKMAKTIVVEIARMKLHSKYRKTYAVSKRYKVHDERGEAKVGDIVRFVEIRPMSKQKRWRLVEKIKKE